MLLAAAAVLAGAATGSATGFGFALVAGPALFALLEPYEAITALAALGFVLSLLILADSELDRVRGRQIVPVLAAALPGLGLGLLAIELAPKAVLQLAVGVAVVFAAAVQMRPRRRRVGPPWAVGLASGSLTTSIGMSGPPLVLWLEGEKAAPTELRATLAVCFLFLSAAGGALLLAAGRDEAIEPEQLLPLLAAVVAGHLVGAVAFRRLAAGPSFRHAVFALVIATGVASAVAGAIGL